MGAAHFLPNPGFEAAILRGRELREHVEELTDTIADAYRAGVPVVDGDLQEGVFSEVEIGPDGVRGRVGNRAWHSGLVELGTSAHGPDGSFRRAVESAGLEPGELGGL